MLGLILGGFTGSFPFSLNTAGIMGNLNNAFSNFKEKTFEFVFPKSENEILIDNLNSNYNLLDRFFSKSSDSILKSKDIPESEKEALKQAVEVFQKTKDQVKTISTEAVKSNPGTIESLIKKTLGLENSNPNSDNPDPTYIPPNCNLVCGE